MTLGVTTAKYLPKLGIHTMRDLAELGIKSADDLVKLAIKNVDDFVEAGLGTLDDANRVFEGASGAKPFLNNDTNALNNMTKGQLKENIPKDWSYFENNGRIHIKDANGNFRVRLDPADKVTKYQHMHIFDTSGNPLDINGNIVGKKSPDGHIPWNK